MLPEWQAMDIAPSWPAFLQSCNALKAKPHWQEVCARAAQLDKNDSAAQRAFYEEWFVPYQVFNPDGSDQGTITGYYEPLLKGSRTKTERFRYPLYGVPDDLLEIDLGDAYPQLKGSACAGGWRASAWCPTTTAPRSTPDASGAARTRAVLGG